ncbi:MAG TPA: hypothetical protein VIL86_15190 [Tepidisphaeraceae bacterium]|jgi:hypothetical protein
MNSLPLKPVEEPKRLTPAPAWVALATAWLGLAMLLASIVFLFLPGSRNPVAELEHRQAYSIKDRFLPYPIYGITITLFLGIVVLWQMRKEPRPLPDALVNQRMQALVGIALALIAAAVIYGYVAIWGPR